MDARERTDEPPALTALIKVRRAGYTECMKNETLKTYLVNFFKCGAMGWCLEILFTSVDSIAASNWKLMGQTSLIMFPIYGLGALLLPIGQGVDAWLSGLPGFEGADARRMPRFALTIRHGLLFMVLIFCAEYVTGSSLMHFGICPWDYSEFADNVNGVIRFHFAPLWFLTGLIFEHITQRK